MKSLLGLARRRDEEEGFTLIELMVVVLIIAILIAIAIPTFLGARTKANDAASKADLRNGLAAEETVYTDNQTYSADTAAGGVLKTTESSLQWGTKPVVIVSAAGDVFCLSEQSQSKTWYALAKVATGANAGVYYKKDTAADPCTTNTATLAGWPTTATGPGSGW